MEVRHLWIHFRTVLFIFIGIVYFPDFSVFSVDVSEFFHSWLQSVIWLWASPPQLHMYLVWPHVPIIYDRHCWFPNLLDPRVQDLRQTVLIQNMLIWSPSRWFPAVPGEHPKLWPNFLLTGQLRLHPLHGNSLLLFSRWTTGQMVCAVWRNRDADLGGTRSKNKGKRVVRRSRRLVQRHFLSSQSGAVAQRFTLQRLGPLSLRGAAWPGGQQWHHRTQGQR